MSPLRKDALRGRRALVVVGPLELGGAERQALLLARRLKSEWGMEIEIWGTMGEPGRLARLCDEHGIPWRIVEVPRFDRSKGVRRHLREARRLVRFARTIREGRFDILLPYMTMPCTVTGLAWRLTGAQSCIWNQRNGSWDSAWPALERAAARLCPVRVSNSKHAAEYMADTLGVARSKIHVVYNGVERAAPLEDRAAWRARLGVDESAFVAAMIANLHERKDHATAIRAWQPVVESLEAEGRRAVLVLAGRHDGAHVRLMALARELGIESSVAFPGQVSDVSGLIDATDLGVLCSYDEGVPNAVLESLAGCVPVVGTDHPGIVEAVGPEAARMLVGREEHERLAEHILTLARDAELRRSMGEKGRMRVEQMFSIDGMVERMAGLIAGAIGMR
jgi:glycosyltransferase involved in cell wall biosynthesis